MGHIIRWDNEDRTVVLQQYEEGATKDDLYHLAQKSADMLHSEDHTVHLIIDERNIRLSLSSSDLKYLEKLVPANQGKAVVIVSPMDIAYKEMFQNIGRKTAPKALAEPNFVTSLEEARAFLQKHLGVRYP
jgi:hypothetical protein